VKPDAGKKFKEISKGETHMKTTILILALVAAASPAARASAITGLCDTGVGGTCATSLSPTTGAIDTHFVSNPLTVAETYYNAAYYSESLTTPALWISTNANGTFLQGGGVYNYTETFDLTGWIPNSVVINGLWGTDDCGTIFVNGVATNQTVGGGIASCNSVQSNFTALTGFSISGLSIALNPGLNTIDFEVYNSPFTPTALLVEYTGVTANSTVPEPSSAALALAGLVLLWCGFRGKANRIPG
jgi:hypothetical protein